MDGGSVNLMGMSVDVDLLRSKISDVRFCIRELLRLASKDFSDLSIDERYSIRYNIVVLVESLVSICMHIAVEAFGKTPSSYREAARFVGERLNLGCVHDLEGLVGLRNLLIHRYWVVDDERVYRSIKENLECVEKLLSRVREEFIG